MNPRRGALPAIEGRRERSAKVLPRPLVVLSWFAGVLAVLWALNAASYPRPPLSLVLLSALAGTCAAALWAFFAAAVIDAGRARRHRALIAALPLAIVLVAGAIWLDAPFRVRWALSKPALARAAALEPLVLGYDDVGRVGMFSIKHIRHEQGGVIFFEKHSQGFMRVGGFAYLPDGPDEVTCPRCGAMSFESIEGDWYLWKGNH